MINTNKVLGNILGKSIKSDTMSKNKGVNKCDACGKTLKKGEGPYLCESCAFQESCRQEDKCIAKSERY